MSWHTVVALLRAALPSVVVPALTALGVVSAADAQACARLVHNVLNW